MFMWYTGTFKYTDKMYSTLFFLKKDVRTVKILSRSYFEKKSLLNMLRILP